MSTTPPIPFSPGSMPGRRESDVSEDDYAEDDECRGLSAAEAAATAVYGSSGDEAGCDGRRVSSC